MSEIKLLVVEDEALVADDLEEALTAAGYTCVVAGTGVAALRELDLNGLSFKGVLTDIRIGRGPSGWDVGQRARELVADMPVIYMSGDSSGDWTSKGVPNSIMIPKPYALAQIITAISQLINAAAMASSAPPHPGEP